MGKGLLLIRSLTKKQRMSLIFLIFIFFSLVPGIYLTLRSKNINFTPAQVPVTPSTPPTSPNPNAKLGDANGDGLVNGADFIIWFNHYKESTINGAKDGDFDESGQVNGADFIIWFNNYKR